MRYFLLLLALGFGHARAADAPTSTAANTSWGVGAAAGNSGASLGLAPSANSPNALGLPPRTNSGASPEKSAAVDIADQSAEDLNKEIQGINAQAQEALKKIDQLTKTASTTAAAPVTNELQRRVLKLGQDGGFLHTAETLWKNEKRAQMLLLQLGWFLFMTLLKGWRMAHMESWLKRIFVGWCFWIITWAGMVYGIPLLVLGRPFALFTSELWQVLVLGN